MTIPLIVPVLKRFDLFTRLVASVDCDIKLYVIDNYNHNRGVSAAWNEGITRAKQDGHKYAIISNDDVVFEKNCLYQIYKTLKETDAALVCANQNFRIKEKIKLVEGHDMFCFGINIPIVESKCGKFDENFYPAYFEDDDMAYRIKLAGLKSYINVRALAWHDVSATQFADPDNPVCPPERFEQLERYYIKKWGGVPKEEKYNNPFNENNREIWEW